MDEVSLIAGEADDGLRERLDQEINAFNAAATGYYDARLLSIAARADDGDLHAGLYGWTWGGCGYVELLWVRDDQRGSDPSDLTHGAPPRRIIRDTDKVSVRMAVVPD